MIKPNTSSQQQAAPKKSQAELLKEKEKSLVSTIMGMKDQLRAAMPKHMDPDRIARIAITAVRENPKLAMCSEASFLGCLLHSTQMGLEPNTKEGLAYLIPYGNECTFQIGYQGVLKLAYNTKEYAKIDANFVLPGDHFLSMDGYEDRLEFARGPTDIGTPIKYFAFFLTKDGGKKHKWWSRERVLAHAQKFSKSFRNGPWVEHFDRMSMKTVLLDLFKYSAKSPELQKAAATDNAIMRLSQHPETKEIILTPSFESLPELNEEGQTETQAAVAEQEKSARDKQRQDMLDRVEKKISERLKNGAEVSAIENAIGMSLDAINDLSTEQLLAVWETVNAAEAPKPEPAPPPPVIDDEKHRLDMLAKVNALLDAKKLANDVIVEKAGMPKSMIQRAALVDLVKIYKALQ